MTKYFQCFIGFVDVNFSWLGPLLSLLYRMIVKLKLILLAVMFQKELGLELEKQLKIITSNSASDSSKSVVSAMVKDKSKETANDGATVDQNSKEIATGGATVKGDQRDVLAADSKENQDVLSQESPVSCQEEDFLSPSDTIIEFKVWEFHTQSQHVLSNQISSFQIPMIPVYLKVTDVHITYCISKDQV